VGGTVLIGVLMGINSDNGVGNKTSNILEKNKTELIGKVNFDGTQFHIINEEDKDWKSCYFTVNGKYRFPTNPTSSRFGSIKSSETTTIRASEFTLDDGTRYNPYSIKPKDFSASCDNRFGFWEWN